MVHRNYNIYAVCDRGNGPTAESHQDKVHSYKAQKKLEFKSDTFIQDRRPCYHGHTRIGKITCYPAHNNPHD